MISIDVFETKNPYNHSMSMSRNFSCPEEETVHIRLDPDRGFETERGYDFLSIQYPSYFNVFSGPIEALDSRFTRPDWFNLETSWLQLTFTSDYTSERKGFVFEMTCQNLQRFNTNSTTSIELTNEKPTSDDLDNSG